MASPVLAPRFNAPLGRRDRTPDDTSGPDVVVVKRPAGVPVGKRLTDPDFIAAAQTVDDVIRALRNRSPKALAVSPARVRDAARVLRALPHVQIPVTPTPAGRAIAERLDARELGFRSHAFAQAVLTVPQDLDDYLAGRPRQGLRNKLSRARNGGVTVTVVAASVGEAAEAAISRSRGAERPGIDTWPVDPGLLTWLVASDEHGSPLAVMCLIFDRDVALLKMSHAVRDHPMSSPARHALHQELVTELSRSGQRYLIGDSGLRAGDGLRTFLHGLGYRACHVRPATLTGQDPSAG